MGRYAQLAVHLFQIQPPFIIEIGRNIAHNLIAPDSQSSGRRNVAHGPLDKAVKGRIGFVPRAYADTYAATGPDFVADPLLGAFFHVIGPFLIAVVDHFLAKTDGSGGTVAGALFAFVAKVLEPEINRFIEGQGEIGGHNRSFESWP